MKKIAIIGGGASGMACAVFLAREGRYHVSVYESGERLGKKLSATGNGQGNVTNINMNASYYFSDDGEKVGRALARFGAEETVAFLQTMGGIFLPDARGRVYPAGRQASAVTDLFRTELARLNVNVKTGARIAKIEGFDNFRLSYAGGEEKVSAVVLCAGGMAAPEFGTDGNGYRLAAAFGHTVTECTPALVKLKCDSSLVRGLKGIRVDANLKLFRGKREVAFARGDLLFAEGGLSGDAVFRISSYAKEGDVLKLDFLPDVSRERAAQAIGAKAGAECLLCVVNNGLGRALYKRAQGNKTELLTLLKEFPVPVTGTFGFRNAQVTKGGIPLSETDEFLQSVKHKGLYFAGEILNVDGACGGYNLQWAFTSAYTVAEGIKRCF